MCPTGGELPSWHGTCPQRSRGPKGGMWLWEVHFRIQKHSLPVRLNVSLTIYCMYSTFQPARQTHRQTSHIWKAALLFRRFSQLPASVIPPREGKWWGWSGWPDGPAVWPQCVYGREGGREGGIHRPYYRPNYTLGLTNSYLTASERNTAGFVLWQLENIHLCFTICHKQAHLMFRGSCFRADLNMRLVHFYTFTVVKINTLRPWNDTFTQVIQTLNNHGSLGKNVLYQSVLPAHISWERTVVELHCQPDHRTEGLGVMMSLFCLSPQGNDLWANLGWSLQIPGLSLPGDLLMVQRDGATTQQKSSQLTDPDIHLCDHTHAQEEKKKQSWIHFAAHVYIQARVYTLMQTNTLAKKLIQNKLRIAYITLAICNLSCSPRQIIEATSQHANRMIISRRPSTKHTPWHTEKKQKHSYIVSGF